jgi:hypothetical protein
LGPTVVYAGRRHLGLEPSDHLIVINDWETRPDDLSGRVDGAGQLIVLDPMSFPFDSFADPLWDVPLAVEVPADPDYGEIQATLGPAVLERLSFYDVLLVEKDSRWKRLVADFGFALGQRMAVTGEEAVAALIAEAEQIRVVAANVAGRHRDLRRYWSLRSRATKSAFRIEASAVAPEIDRARDALPTGTVPHALLLGSGVGAWPQLLASRGFTMEGFDLNRGMVAQAAFGIPETSFRYLGPGGGLPPGVETADLALCVGVFGRIDVKVRQHLLEQIWHRLKPGAACLVLDDFVESDASRSWLPVRQMLATVAEATGHHAVLDDVRVLRYDGEGAHQVGLLSFLKIGNPETL